MNIKKYIKANAWKSTLATPCLKGSPDTWNHFDSWVKSRELDVVPEYGMDTITARWMGAGATALGYLLCMLSTLLSPGESQWCEETNKHCVAVSFGLIRVQSSTRMQTMPLTGYRTFTECSSDHCWTLHKTHLPWAWLMVLQRSWRQARSFGSFAK